MLRTIAVILVLAFGGAAWAQPSLDCNPHTPEEVRGWRVFLKTLGDDWLLKRRAEETRKIGDDPSVYRYLDRLYLVIDEGYKLVTLVDCPVDKSAMAYFYEGYDEVGRFYVVKKGEYEDFYYILVSRNDGAQTRAVSRPAWSPDKTHFVHGRYSAMNGPDTISIVGRAQGGLRTEATFDLPCNGRPCTFQWEDASTVSATCVSGRTLKVARKDDTWSLVP